MPLAERATRRKNLVARLTGLCVVGVNDPSYKLIDKMSAMLDANVLRYVPWEDCTSRDQEVISESGRAPNRDFSTDARGYLKTSVGTADIYADASSPLLVKDALTRRGLAAELGGIMSYESHDKLSRFLFKHFNKPPPDSRYANVTLEQLRSCDKAVFIELGERTRDGIRRLANGTLPLDNEIDDVLRSFEVVALVTPLPQRASTGTAKRANAPETEEEEPKPGRMAQRRAAKRNRAAAQEAALQKLRQEVSSLKSAGRDEVSKGKGKGRSNVPRELIGKTTTMPDGTPICFNYNLGGCNDAQPGDKCRRGLHVCAEPGCQSRTHALRRHGGGAASSRG